MGLKENYKEIVERIERACERVGRDPASVSIVAVAKGHPAEAVREATEIGLKIFGENKVQEAKAKIPLCPPGIKWHMIGHLQMNKVKDAVQLFDMIHSVDSLRAVMEISKRAMQFNKIMPILLEVNVSGETSKFGYSPSMLKEEIKEIIKLPDIDLQGLMTMAPFLEDPQQTRPYFKRLRELKQECEDVIGKALPHLSMGMTNDFEVAVEEGATYVRIGTALFGERAY